MTQIERSTARQPHPLRYLVRRLIREGMPGVERVNPETFALMLRWGREPCQRHRTWRKLSEDLLEALAADGELERVEVGNMPHFGIDRAKHPPTRHPLADHIAEAIEETSQRSISLREAMTCIGFGNHHTDAPEHFETVTRCILADLTRAGLLRFIPSRDARKPARWGLRVDAIDDDEIF